MQPKLSINANFSELENYKAIVEIVNYVEWGDAHKCMELLGWEWAFCGGVPEVQQLMQEATERSVECVQKSIDSKQDYYTSCGGIAIMTKYFPEGEVALIVQFVLTEWDNYL